MYLKDDEIQKEQQEENGVERRQVLTQYGEDLGMGGGRERYIGCDAHYSKTHSVGDHVCGLDIREQKSGYIEATVGEGGQKVAVEQHQVVLVDGRGNVVLLAGEDMLDPVRHLGVREEREERTVSIAYTPIASLTYSPMSSPLFEYSTRDNTSPRPM